MRQADRDPRSGSRWRRCRSPSVVRPCQAPCSSCHMMPTPAISCLQCCFFLLCRTSTCIPPPTVDSPPSHPAPTCHQLRVLYYPHNSTLISLASCLSLSVKTL